MADFLFGLNTSTIQPAGLLEKIRIAGQAGYDAIELWINDVEQYVEAGNPLDDVVHALDDQQLLRPSMISLRDWCVADDAAWQAAVDSARRRLEMATRLGVVRIVAGPPRDAVPHELAVDRYGRLLEVSVDYGVPASLEFLGFVAGINRLEVAWRICAGTGNPQATITPDAWHMFRGASDFAALDAIPADHLSCFHWNDAPAEPPRVEQSDADRVHPGDGVLDLKSLADQLRAKSWRGVLSLELFNRGYWEQNPLQVAEVGLEKMRRSVGVG